MEQRPNKLLVLAPKRISIEKMHSMPVTKLETIKISHSSQFTYQNTLGYKRDRIFDPFTYRHINNEDALEALLQSYIIVTSKAHDKAIDLLEDIDENEYLNKYTDSVKYAKMRVKHLKFLIEVVNTNLIRHFEFEEDEEDSLTLSTKMGTLNSHSDDSEDATPIHKMKSILNMEQSIYEGFGPSLEVDDRLDEIGNFYGRLDRDIIDEFLSGERLICVPAVTTVFLGIHKILIQLGNAFQELETKPERDQHKKVFSFIMKLSGCFDYFYGALLAKSTSPYYKEKESKYLRKHLEFVNVEDVKNYWKLADKGYEEVGRIIGVASRGLKHESKAKQILSFIGWMPTYFLFRKKKGTDQGLFFMNALNRNIFHRVTSFQEANIVKFIAKLRLPKVEVESKLYITMPIDDVLTEDRNLSTTSTPKMVSKDSDLPFSINLKNYDSSEHIKLRVIAKEDWGRVNWK